jgi:2-amino-4-hydroxy-6-hydroxymethyldihydropteridine diphosphokinase
VTDTTLAYIGLGANVGDARATMERAIRALAALPGVRLVGVSGLYRTKPVGDLDQPDFLNAVAEIETELGPEELLKACKAVERELGREQGGPRHGPRPIDVDLLLLGDLEYESERLVLPHREVLTRRFVLEPLLELDPELTLPDGTALGVAADALEGQRVERVGVL